MGAVVDKNLHEERIIDEQLMQLSLVNISMGLNSCYSEINGRSIIIDYIMNHQKSFKLIQQIIKMSSQNFLKPF